MKVSAQYAEQHFADLATAASNGEEVEIELPGKPTLFLAPRTAQRQNTPSGRPRRELWGAWEGLITPPTQEEWDKTHQQLLDDMPDFSKVGSETA